MEGDALTLTLSRRERESGGVVFSGFTPTPALPLEGEGVFR